MCSHSGCLLKMNFFLKITFSFILKALNVTFSSYIMGKCLIYFEYPFQKS